MTPRHRWLVGVATPLSDVCRDIKLYPPRSSSGAL